MAGNKIRLEAQRLQKGGMRRSESQSERAAGDGDVVRLLHTKVEGQSSCKYLCFAHSRTDSLRTTVSNSFQPGKSGYYFIEVLERHAIIPLSPYGYLGHHDPYTTDAPEIPAPS